MLNVHGWFVDDDEEAVFDYLVSLLLLKTLALNYLPEAELRLHGVVQGMISAYQKLS